MKVTRKIYIRNSSQHLTTKEIADTLFIFSDEDVNPRSWVEIKDFSINSEGKLEINIPDSLINDIIGANTETDISKKIAKHEAEITRLMEFRNRGK